MAARRVKSGARVLTAREGERSGWGQAAMAGGVLRAKDESPGKKEEKGYDRWARADFF